MRVVVGGGRYLNDPAFVFAVLDWLDETMCFTRLAHGGCHGADMLVDQWARSRRILPRVYLAQWDKYKKAAGPIRNGQMLTAERPDVVIGLPGGSGTRDLIKQAQSLNIHTIEVDGFFRTEKRTHGR